jgi:deoxyribodipyrimidine photo-lyase
MMREVDGRRIHGHAKILRVNMPSVDLNHFAKVLVWFRRDLRLDDHTALSHALRHSDQVFGAFVFDRAILDSLPRRDRRVAFIHASLQALDAAWQDMAGSADAGVLVRHGPAVTEIVALAKQLGVQAVLTHHDDEPDALARDALVIGALADAGISFQSFKDHVVFERSEVLTQSGHPYGVFTPYKNAWLKKVTPHDLAARNTPAKPGQLANVPTPLRQPMPSMADLGFEAVDLAALHIHPGMSGAQALVRDFETRMDKYDATRNFPAVKGPSYLSVHLRFGTVSIRQLARLAYPRAMRHDLGAQTWLSELIWRDFYHQVLHHHPHVVEKAFKAEYDLIHWDKDKQAKALFKAWCDGQTGYPLVDAAMAQINQTGYMHNRLRMVVASFLVKDLGIDWRWGEQYFAQHLLDFDLAANNGGWQWASSSGCDAQPYFRIFNPVNQSEKFDPNGKFIRRYLPQLAGLSDKAIHTPWLAKPLELQAAGITLGEHYPMPVVDHAQARAKTLLRYSVVKKS